MTTTRQAIIEVSHPDVIRLESLSLAEFVSKPLMFAAESYEYFAKGGAEEIGGVKYVRPVPNFKPPLTKEFFGGAPKDPAEVADPAKFFAGENTPEGYVLAKRDTYTNPVSGAKKDLTYVSMLRGKRKVATPQDPLGTADVDFLLAKLPKIYIQADLPAPDAPNKRWVFGDASGLIVNNSFAAETGNGWRTNSLSETLSMLDMANWNDQVSRSRYTRFCASMDSDTGVVDYSKLYLTSIASPVVHTVDKTLLEDETLILPIYPSWSPYCLGSGTDKVSVALKNSADGYKDIVITVKIPNLSYGLSVDGSVPASTSTILQDAWVKITIPIDGKETLRILQGKGNGGGTTPVVPKPATPPIMYAGAQPPNTPEATVAFAAQIVGSTVNTPVNAQMFVSLTAAASFLGPDAFRRSRIAILLSGGDPLGAAEAFGELQTYIDLKLDPDERKALQMAKTLHAALSPYKDTFLSGGMLDEFGEYRDTPQSLRLAQAQPGYVPRPQFLPNEPVGFCDPHKQYPKPSHSGEPDTSRVMRQERARASSVQKKELGRHRKVIMANQRGTWDQPAAGYNAQYPYNQSTVTESGHVFELDDTPGSERINLYHRSGTFIEVDNNGTQVRRTVGDDYTILERDGKVHIVGRADVTVQGATSLRVENTLDLEVHGVTNINIFNHANIRVAGDTTLMASGNVSARVLKSVNVVADQDINLASKGNVNISSEKDIIMAANGRLEVNAKGNLQVSCGDVTQIGSTGKIYIHSDENTYTQRGNVRTGGKTVPAIPTVLPDPKFDPKRVVLPPLAPMNRAEQAGAVFESPDEGDPSAWKAQRVREGTTSAAALERQPSVDDKATAASGRDPQPVDVQVPGGRAFRADDQLSKYFQLKDLTHNYSRKLTDRFGTTAEQKFKALAYLCSNALDIIKEKYPSMVITSGLRDFVPAGGSQKSQHLIGEAVDIQFPGLDRKGHMARAKEISALIPFDQLLLEYVTPGGNGWIHISLKPSPRKQAFTMNNHRRASKDGELVAIA